MFFAVRQVGLSNNRSSYDEALLDAIRQASRAPANKLLIADARPKLNARANKTQGKGFENTGSGSAYPNCELVFCNIGNIHVMRKSLDAMRAVCNTPSMAGVARNFADDKVALEVTSTWLSHLSRVISAAGMVVSVRCTAARCCESTWCVMSCHMSWLCHRMWIKLACPCSYIAATDGIARHK